MNICTDTSQFYQQSQQLLLEKPVEVVLSTYSINLTEGSFVNSLFVDLKRFVTNVVVYVGVPFNFYTTLKNSKVSFSFRKKYPMFQWRFCFNLHAKCFLVLPRAIPVWKGFVGSHNLVDSKNLEFMVPVAGLHCLQMLSALKDHYEFSRAKLTDIRKS